MKTTLADVDIIMKMISIQDILKKLGIKYKTVARPGRQELYFTCVNPSHKSTKQTMSIVADGPTKGLFFCWSCHSKGNLFHFLKMVEGLDFKEAVDWLSEGEVPILDSKSILFRTLKEERKVEEEIQLQPVDLPGDFVRCGINNERTRLAEKFLINRGIQPAEWDYYEIGVSSYPGLGDCLTIPIRFDGTIVSVFWAEPKSGGQKRYPRHAPNKYILFNYDRASEEGEYILCESILDAIRFSSEGLPPGLASFSNYISEYQAKLLAQFDEHYICPDMDSERGWDLVELLVKYYGKEVMLALPPTGYDPGDCTSEEIRLAYMNATPYYEWEVNNAFAKRKSNGASC